MIRDMDNNTIIIMAKNTTNVPKVMPRRVSVSKSIDAKN